jgi:hypothetical protein
VKRRRPRQAYSGNVPAVGRKRLLPIALVACAALCAAAPTANAARTFKPRIAGALGIVPPAGHQEVATSSSVPLVYHGGLVMHHVTVHTLFWAPTGFHFDGSPSALVPGYEQLIKQFFSDVAADSGKTSNEFSLLGQYPDSTGPGTYSISYSATQDSVDDTNPYPPLAQQCSSPSGVATCVTTLEVEQELDRVISAQDPSGRGLGDLWFVFLPPDVDTCVLVQQCGTNAYGGYHSLANFGHGPDIYALIPDPLIEFTPAPGADPEGNPEAELAADVAGHELAEAITDPEGAGWLDPSGFEVGDKCEIGPEDGTPLGYGLDGSPYNEVIGGHQYLLQMMWSNSDSGCKQRSSVTVSSPGLATVSMTQFSGRITGVATPHVSVEVRLVRSGAVVARGVTRAGATGSWALTLDHGLGDDRDVISIRYGSGGPPGDHIATGNGGDPYSQAGFTGWYDLDSGYAVTHEGVLLAPCSQVGVLTLTVRGTVSPPPIESCDTETDVAGVATRPIGSGTPVTFSSEDNRASSPGNPYGALVKLTLPLGEPDSAPSLANDQVPFISTGFPTCTADLERQMISCDGLVPETVYTVARGRARTRARAQQSGEIHVSRLPGPGRLVGGDVVTLRNGPGRVLTVLHVAHLQVALENHGFTVASGRCQPGEWWGPVSAPVPPGLLAILGLSPSSLGGGAMCPLSGRARGLPGFGIQQTDDRSGGVTRTSVPQLTGFSPEDGAELYGKFVVVAKLGSRGAGSTVAVSITGSGREVFHAGNVATRAGADVRALPKGVYTATWTVRDRNGDTRTVRSRLIEAG